MIGAGQLYGQVAQQGPPATVVPAGGGGGSWIAPQPSLSNITAGTSHSSTYVKIDTTSLWTANGGTLSGAQTLQIDSVNAATIYGAGYPGEPTVGSPILTLLMKQGTRIISIGTYTWTMDVPWRGFPWTARADSAPNPNNYYFGGAPSAVVGDAAGPPFQNTYFLNEPWAVVPNGPTDGSGDTSAEFTVMTGDQPYQAALGSTQTKDTRAEFNFQDDYGSGSYSTGTNPMPGIPSGGIDVIGNKSRTVRFWRLDYIIPTAWTPPNGVVLQNNDTTWAASPAPQPPALATYGRGVFPVTPNNGSGSLNPSWPGTPPVTATNPANALAVLSNLLELGGPAVMVLGRGTNAGAGLEAAFQPVSLGQSLAGGAGIALDAHNFTFDTRESIIMEYCPNLFATGNGQPWMLNAAPSFTNPWYANLAADLKKETTVSGYPIFPYGMPVDATGQPNTPFGGGYLRLWRLKNNVWTCVTAGTTYAVPGTPYISGGVIQGDPAYPQYGTDSGKIFGPTMKSNNAILGQSGTTIIPTSGSAPPFDIYVTGVVAGTGFFGTSGSIVYVNGEQMLYTSYTQNPFGGGASTGKFHVTARAQNGTSAINHSAGEQVYGLIDILVASPGINSQISLLHPSGGSSATIYATTTARLWPLLIGPTFASVDGVPATSYP